MRNDMYRRVVSPWGRPSRRRWKPVRKGRQSAIRWRCRREETSIGLCCTQSPEYLLTIPISSITRWHRCRLTWVNDVWIEPSLTRCEFRMNNWRRACNRVAKLCVWYLSYYSKKTKKQTKTKMNVLGMPKTITTKSIISKYFIIGTKEL